MTFDIDKMKADGVSSHLIELASMEQETFLLLIARRLEHDKLFQQFMGENASSIEAMYPYAVAAGLMSEEDRLWLIDEENPYKSQSGEVWYTGTLGECEGGYATALLTETDKADTDALGADAEAYSVSVGEAELPLADYEQFETGFEAAFGDETLFVDIAKENGATEIAFRIACPTDITNVEVTVAHK